MKSNLERKTFMSTTHLEVMRYSLEDWNATNLLLFRVKKLDINALV